MKFLANGKINLGLNVLRKRSDGYHNLESIFLPIELADEIDIELLPKGYESIVKTNIPSLNNSGNIVYRALRSLTEMFSLQQAFSIYIKKNIPDGAGLAGGTSDAINVALKIIELLNLNLTKSKKDRLIKEIGSDSAFFFTNKPAKVTSIGDVVTPISVRRSYFVLLVKPKEPLLTIDVFAKYDQLNIFNNSDINLLEYALEEGHLAHIKEATANALFDAACAIQPILIPLNNLLQKKIPDAVISMTGSGNTMFALTEKKTFKLKNLAKKFARLGYTSIITKTKIN